MTSLRRQINHSFCPHRYTNYERAKEAQEEAERAKGKAGQAKAEAEAASMFNIRRLIGENYQENK